MLKTWWLLGSFGLSVLISGCAERTVDLSQVHQPAKPAELDNYGLFVGDWHWEAELLNATAPDRRWTGTARWAWALDGRCLTGTLSAASERAKFEAVGAWIWNPAARKYEFAMFDNWGYPREGTASYDAASRTWNMRYEGVGLDGTRSYGRYTIRVIDANTLDWRMEEWADRLGAIKKMEMRGAYKRKT